MRTMRLKVGWVALGCMVSCGPGSTGDAGDVAIRDVPSDAATGFDGSGPDTALDTGGDQAVSVDAAGTDVAVASADAPADTLDAASDAALDAAEATRDAAVDAADAPSCGLIGMACDTASTTGCPSGRGYGCYGLGGDAGGGCLDTQLTRFICGDGRNHCPSSADRCLLSYGYCLFDYEVPCVCTAHPSACGPP